MISRTLKIKRLEYNDDVYLKRLIQMGFLTLFDNKMLKLHDVKLMNTLNEYGDALDYVKELKQRIQDLKDELESLKRENPEQKIDEINQKYSDLKESYEALQQDYEQVQATVASQDEKEQELQEIINRLQKENKEALRELEREEDIKQIFHKYGKYISLQKDLDILLFFMENSDRSIRLVEVNERFSHSMAKATVAVHMKSLKDRGFLKDGVHFGEYKLNKSSFHGLQRDMRSLVRAIVGDHIFEVAVGDRAPNENY